MKIELKSFAILAIFILVAAIANSSQLDNKLWLPNQNSNIEAMSITFLINDSNIQAAIDASNPGETIVLPAREYNENIHIQKTLTIRGAGIDKTIVKPPNGSVFIIGNKTDYTINVNISGMTIEGGTGTSIDGQFCGGGIINYGNLTISSSKISSNGAELSGAIINPFRLNLKEDNFSIGNKATLCGGGIWNNGVLTLNHVTIANNSANSYGGGIYNDYGGAVNMNTGTSIYNNKADCGGGILNFGIMNLSGGTISSNTANKGGGFFNGGTADLTGGSIDHNTASSVGGGIFNDRTLYMNGCSISNNNANQGGGAFTSGTLNLKSGSISSNTGYFASGIAVDGTLNMYGGSIDHNVATHEVGGVYVDGAQGKPSGVMNMYGGSVSYNTANISGGVHVDGTMLMNSGSIHHNTANDGGGMLVWGKFTMNGGSITQNTANELGGGIYVDWGINDFGIPATINLKGGSIDHNTARNNGGGIYNDGGNINGDPHIVQLNFPNNISSFVSPTQKRHLF